MNRIIFFLPYFYIPTGHLKRLHWATHNIIDSITRIHNKIPCRNANTLDVKRFLYHPSVMIWAHDKVAKEMVSRGLNHKTDIPEYALKLNSRPTSEFIPPKTNLIIQDVVSFVNHCRHRKSIDGARKLPYSYVRLAEQYASLDWQHATEFIDTENFHTLDFDHGWYFG